MKARLLGAMLVVLLARGVHAQGSVRGVVYDSIARSSLANAIVQAVLVEPGAGAPPGAMMVFTAVSDSTGAYHLPPLPRGKFALGFQHDVLNVLGMESPIWALDVKSDTSFIMDLAVPSGPTISAHVCSPGDGHTAMLVGYVRDAMRGSGLASADVVVTWTEMDFSAARPVTAPRSVRTKTGDGGTYVACGVASAASVSVSVSAPRLRTVVGDVTMPASSLLRQDFTLADSGTTRGTASIAGRVTVDDSTRLSAGRAIIEALGIDVEIAAGRFTIAAIPAGTWRVDIRAIGYEPHSLLVNADHGAATPLHIALDRRAQRLDAVSVVGKPGRDLTTLAGIADRMRTSAGTAFLPGNSWLVGATFPADVVRGARGFRYKSPTEVDARQYFEKFTGRACMSATGSDSAMAARGRVPVD